MKDNKMILALGLTGIAAGALWLILKPRQVSAAENTITSLSSPIQTIKLSGFTIPVDMLIKDLQDKGYITNISCKISSVILKECNVTVYSNMLNIVKQMANIYGVSFYG